MKQTALVFALLLTLASSFVAAQNYLTFAGFKNTAINHIYLTNGLGISAGHQYRFKKNFFIASELNISILKRNKEYTIEEEPQYADYLKYFDLFEHTPEIYYGNMNLNTGLGYIFCSKHRINPFVKSGISLNRIKNEYTVIEHIVNEYGEGISIVQTESVFFTIGFTAHIGLKIKVTETIGAQTSLNFNSLPYAKIGIQQKNVNTYGWQIGITKQI